MSSPNYSSSNLCKYYDSKSSGIAAPRNDACHTGSTLARREIERQTQEKLREI